MKKVSIIQIVGLASIATVSFSCGGSKKSTPSPTPTPAKTSTPGPVVYNNPPPVIIVTPPPVIIVNPEPSSGSSTGGSVSTGSGSSTGGSVSTGSGSSSGGSVSTGSGSSSGGSVSTGSGSSSGGSVSTGSSSSGSSSSGSSSTGSSGTASSTGGTISSSFNSGNGAEVCTTVEQCAAQAQSFNAAVNDLSSIEGAGNSISDSVGGTTADVNNQQAAIAQQDQTARAQSLSSQFQMSFESAKALTELSDQVKTLTASGQMTDEDRAAVMDKTLAIAGITSEEVNAATAAAIKSGDTSAMDALMVKAAQKLGMPSDQGLRDKLLPALGLQF